MTSNSGEWIEPVEGTIDERLARLERMATNYRINRQEEDRLTSGVERLGEGVSDLNAVLIRVDEQAQAISQAEKRTQNASRKAEAAAFDVEASKATAVIERKVFLRRIYATAAATILFTACVVIGGAWLTDAHTNRCLLDGPLTEEERKWCNITFPGHDHPIEHSLAFMLQQGQARQLEAILNTRKGCERTNETRRGQIEREERLAEIDAPETRDIHIESANEMRKQIVDCNAAYPIPPNMLDKTPR